jgi:hypothetical protein
MTDGFIERSRAARRQRLNNVSLRHNTYQTPVRSEYQNGADALFGKELCRVSQAGAGLNRNDLATFLTQNGPYSHDRLPMFHRLFRRHTATGGERLIANVWVDAEFRPAELHPISRRSNEPAARIASIDAHSGEYYRRESGVCKVHLPSGQLGRRLGIQFFPAMRRRVECRE